MTKNEKKDSSIYQGELFKPGDILLDELSKINVENISPIQALNILNSLKEKLKMMFRFKFYCFLLFFLI